MKFDIVPAFWFGDESVKLIKEYFEEILLNSWAPQSEIDNLSVDEDSILNAFAVTCDEELAGFIIIDVQSDESLHSEDESKPVLKIFNFFIREKYRGQGLGLSVIRRLTEEWDGCVCVMTNQCDLAGQEFWIDAAKELNWTRLYDKPEFLKGYFEEIMLRWYETHSSHPEKYPTELFVLDLITYLSSR